MPDYFRGHQMHRAGDDWVFSDTDESVLETWLARPCGHCGLFNTFEGHDGCLGTLPGVMNACCGHGQRREAYLQLRSGHRIAGRRAQRLAAALLQDDVTVIIWPYLYVAGADMRASTRRMLVPLADAAGVMFWRTACRICDWLGLRARTEYDTHRIRLWVQTHTIRACLRTRNLLQEWPKQ